MKNPLKAFLGLGVLSFIWPVIHFTVAYIRFGAGFEGGFLDALVFLPMGAISGGFLIYWMEVAKSRDQRMITLLGYILGSPMAFIGSLAGGLFMSPAILGVTLFGGIPLVLGAFFGFYFSRNMTDKE